MRFSAALVLLLTLAASCQVETTQHGEVSRSIIGGTPAPNDPAVVMVNVFGLCTGTLIAPNVVLTAAHCVSSAIEAGRTNVGSIRFVQNDDTFATRTIVDMVMHRLYDDGAFTSNDIALVRMGEDAPPEVQPIPFNTRDLNEDDVGREVRTVGFGNDDGTTGTGAGTKRQVRMNIDAVLPQHVALGTNSKNTCQGDSGGPTFSNFGDGEEVVAVTSFGSQECMGQSFLARVDAQVEVFVAPVLAAWTGPCPADGSCDEGCELADPDCDICSFEGYCGTDCEVPDFDCPRGGLAGAPCGSDFDCETRLCTPGLDDPRVGYCSVPCDPAIDAMQQCPAPLTICEKGVCAYAGVSPGAQGWSCDDGSECRSSACDLEADGICVEPCESDDECGDEFSCISRGGGSFCTIPKDDGGCSASGGGGLPLSLLILGLVLALWRRPRSRGARV